MRFLLNVYVVWQQPSILSSLDALFLKPKQREEKADFPQVISTVYIIGAIEMKWALHIV